MELALIVFVIVFAASFGSRGQVLVAQLSAGLGRTTGLLAMGVLSIVIVTTIAAFAGDGLSAIVRGDARALLLTAACVLAALELLWPVRVDRAAEPTRSHFAIASVLAARQLPDAARLGVFVGAGMTPVLVPALVGGMLGGIAATALGWWLGDVMEQLRGAQNIRWFTAAVFIAIAIHLLLAMSRA